jgi:hypothetical protein
VKVSFHRRAHAGRLARSPASCEHGRQYAASGLSSRRFQGIPWFLGYPHQALHKSGEALTTALQFAADVTRESRPKFVPPADRIATFDNDGTLWVEQPMYFQLIFGLDRVKALAPQHPEWKDQEPFKSLLAGDLKGVLAGGEPAIVHPCALPLPPYPVLPPPGGKGRLIPLIRGSLGEVNAPPP